MDDAELSRLLPRLPVRRRPPAADCADEAMASAYVDGGLDTAARERLELHLADCPDCLSQVAFLARIARTAPAAPAPARRAGAAATRRHLRWVPALAASLVLAAAATTLLMREPAQSPTLRTRAATAPAALRVVAPHEGEIVERSALEVRWRGVPGALGYTVQLMNAAGDVLWEGRADGDHLRLPAGLELESGRLYYAWVEAHLPGGVSLRSRATSFELSSP